VTMIQPFTPSIVGAGRDRSVWSCRRDQLVELKTLHYGSRIVAPVVGSGLPVSLSVACQVHRQAKQASGTGFASQTVNRQPMAFGWHWKGGKGWAGISQPSNSLGVWGIGWLAGRVGEPADRAFCVPRPRCLCLRRSGAHPYNQPIVYR
jgi:hypothetical protein